jgi:hypothetical protein
LLESRPAINIGIVPVSASVKLDISLREEHKQRVLENKVPKGIFELHREEVTEGWRKLRNEEFHSLYCSPKITWVTSGTQPGANMGKMRSTYNISVGEYEERSPLGRHRLKWKNNIKMEPK